MNDLGQFFKYSTEAQLNVTRDECVLFSLEELNVLQEDTYLDDFHIYAILARPRYSFNRSSLAVTKAGINIDLLDEDKKSFCSIMEFKRIIKFHGIVLDDLNYEYLQISCEPPYTQINCTFCESKDLVAYLSKKMKSGKIEDDIKKAMHEFKFSVHVDELIIEVYKKQNMNYDMEVLYIGQAQGREANRGAVERLKSHETLKKILIDCHTKFTDKCIYIMMFKFIEQQIMFMNGWDDTFLSTKKDDEQHHNQIVNDAINLVLNEDKDRERQVINITEAAMINYFKPPYNINNLCPVCITP